MIFNIIAGVFTGYFGFQYFGVAGAVFGAIAGVLFGLFVLEIEFD